MLKLSRRIGETISLGDDISVQILGTRGRHIQLGIQAPRSVPILRAELISG
jgi:carbon storage regulator